MEWCFFKEAALIATVATIGSTITRNGDFQGNQARCHDRSASRPPFSSFARYCRAMADRQGGACSGLFPGPISFRPWAVLLNHFMVSSPTA
jgi:hypothetical protein